MYKAKFAEYNNNIPFREFLESLTFDERADIIAAIDKLLELKNSNNRISEKLSRYLRDGVYEVRVRHLNRSSRSLYFFEENQLLIFTNGFIKKTEKTPIKEIERAIKIRKNYENKL